MVIKIYAKNAYESTEAAVNFGEILRRLYFIRMNVERNKTNIGDEPEAIVERLLTRYPELTDCIEEIDRAYDVLVQCFQNGGRLLVAGNGGSAADSEHISGELMKSFRFRRGIDPKTRFSLKELFGAEGERLGTQLEGALPVIPLVSFTSVLTAYSNDTNPAAAFAQVLYGCSRPEDVFLAITTSGNSENIYKALMIARAKEISTICLTGRDGGHCGRIADVTIHVPEDETYRIQELHLPVYHALCAMLEAHFFRQQDGRITDVLPSRRDRVRV